MVVQCLEHAEHQRVLVVIVKVMGSTCDGALISSSSGVLYFTLTFQARVSKNVENELPPNGKSLKYVTCWKARTRPHQEGSPPECFRTDTGTHPHGKRAANTAKYPRGKSAISNGTPFPRRAMGRRIKGKVGRRLSKMSVRHSCFLTQRWT